MVQTQLPFPITVVGEQSNGTEFCFSMIGRADIEGSKSNIAMNTRLPQASYLARRMSVGLGWVHYQEVSSSLPRAIFLREGIQSRTGLKRSPLLGHALDNGPIPFAHSRTAFTFLNLILVLDEGLEQVTSDQQQGLGSIRDTSQML
ncbi:MAG: hypothetical protein J3R72DRAFT_499008 [Linnemannia gamsii]|nr:MAG: hypothetical protein J3R72DRAFT_499008 [Linnemannia gamsii]